MGPMATLHKLLIDHGRDEMIRRASPSERPLVDIAARVLSDESTNLGITYSGFCLTAPYGSRARMILIYLQTRAVLDKTPIVELGKSMNAWLARMDIPICGQNYRDVREQAARLSACRLTFYWKDDLGRNSFKKDSIVQEGIRLQPDDKQGSLWQDTVRLSDSFYNSLCEHPVPIWEPAVRAISGKSMAIDIYIWLAYRLHVLPKATPISWSSLHKQFGAGFKHARQFKPEFRRCLGYALAVYPEAIVTDDDEGDGITLHPSRPPIPERLIGVR